MRWVRIVVFWLLLGLLLFLLSLFCSECRLPQFLIDAVTERLSGERFKLSIARGSFGFRRGVAFTDIVCYDLSAGGGALTPAVRARSARWDFFRSRLTVDELEYDRLPPEFYAPTAEPYAPERLDLTLPDLPVTEVVLEHPSILDLELERLSATVSCTPKHLRVDGAVLTMPEQDYRTGFGGDLDLDLERQSLRGIFRGTARHAQIAPVVKALGYDCALPYIESFTEVATPVPGEIRVTADLTTKEMDLSFLVKPQNCRYAQVPMRRAEGLITVRTRPVETSLCYQVEVQLPVAHDVEGRSLSGMITVDDFEGLPRLTYEVESSLAFGDFLKISDFLTPDMFPGVVCESAPEVKLRGTSATEREDLAANRLHGTVSVASGRLDGMQLAGVSGGFELVRDRLDLRASAKGREGGEYAWDGTFDFAGFQPENATCSLKTGCRGGTLAEIADMFTFDLGDRRGQIDLDFEFSSMLGTNALPSMVGAGKLKITEGHLGQMRLFAGLTKLLAERVPGVSSLVNQTDASAAFSVRNGAFSTDELVIEGGLVSIRAWGKYDFLRDQLDFRCRVRLLSGDNFAGKIVHVLTYPVTAALLEFKVSGPIDNPDWEYVNPIEKIIE